MARFLESMPPVMPGLLHVILQLGIEWEMSICILVHVAQPATLPHAGEEDFLIFFTAANTKC